MNVEAENIRFPSKTISLSTERLLVTRRARQWILGLWRRCGVMEMALQQLKVHVTKRPTAQFRLNSPRNRVTSRGSAPFLGPQAQLQAEIDHRDVELQQWLLLCERLRAELRRSLDDGALGGAAGGADLKGPWVAGGAAGAARELPELREGEPEFGYRLRSGLKIHGDPTEFQKSQ